MKLLLDENLSRRLIPFLQQDFPGSTQVALIGLERADDGEIWEFWGICQSEWFRHRDARC